MVYFRGSEERSLQSDISRVHSTPECEYETGMSTLCGSSKISDSGLKCCSSRPQEMRSALAMYQRNETDNNWRAKYNKPPYLSPSPSRLLLPDSLVASSGEPPPPGPSSPVPTLRRKTTSESGAPARACLPTWPRTRRVSGSPAQSPSRAATASCDRCPTAV